MSNLENKMKKLPILPLTLLLCAPLFAQTQPFLALDTPRKAFHNLNVETVRGMAWAPDRSQVFAINTHGSRLVMHLDGDGVPDGNWTTVHNPVAMAIWNRGDNFEVIVLGGGTHALVSHNPRSGAINRVLNLPSEPGDLVIAPDDHAFVSCMGANVVVEIDLATFTIVNTYNIPSQRPRFLNIVTPDAGPYRVFVAPFLSGNNTTLDANDSHRTRTLPDDVIGTAAFEGLPDEDLFELIPSTGAVLPVVKELGSMILDHTIAPNGDYWVLSIVSENGDPARQNEPALSGDFAENAVTIFSLPPQGTTIRAPAHIDLDDTDPSPTNVVYDALESCSFPFSVAIHPTWGWAFVAGSTSDRILLLDSAGGRTGWKRDLAPGSIPRQVLVDLTTNTLLVYLWGTNEILVLFLNDLNGLGLTLDLGLDPTPDSIARGRAHWYDAENSDFARSTCNTCHPGGGADFLGWPVSDEPADRKDVMVTQSLLSIEDTFPYHWRGERQLRDFNRLAFPGILGGQALGPADFADFQDFVFSLQAPRNPGQSITREVDDSLVQAPTSAINGQDAFENTISLANAFACAGCHTQPEGTNGAITADSLGNPGGRFPSENNEDVTHLRQLFNKETIEITVGSEQLPRSGWALTHTGGTVDLEAFITGFALTPQEVLDVTAFVKQWDQGIAPAAQMAWLLDSTTQADIQQFLLNQASNPGDPWLDVVAFGTVTDNAGFRRFARWLYDPQTNTFIANDQNLTLPGRPPGTALFSDFLAQPAGSNTFLGLPLGNGYRFALDPDFDQLDDGGELTAGTDPEHPDTDRDGDVDGHEVLNGGAPLNPAVGSNDTLPPSLVAGFPVIRDQSARTGEIELRFDEPVQYTLTYSRPGEPAQTRTREHFVTEDTITIQDLRPSTIDLGFIHPFLAGVSSTYSVSLSATDRGGNALAGSVPLLMVTTDEQPSSLLTGIVTFPLPLFLRDLSLGLSAKTTNSMLLNVNMDVDALHETINANGGPPGLGLVTQVGQRVLAQVLIDDGSGNGWQVVPATQLSGPEVYQTVVYWEVDAMGNPISSTPAPFGDVVLSTTTTNPAALATATVTISGLNPGDLIRFNIVGIMTEYTPPSSPPTQANFFIDRRFAWQMPNTEDDPGGDPSQSNRSITIVF